MKPARHLIQMTISYRRAVDTSCGLLITGQKKYFSQTTNLVEDVTCKNCRKTIHFLDRLRKVVYERLRDSGS